MDPDDSLARLVADVRACTACDGLPLGPRPILAVSRTARLVIASQAPGTLAHASGQPWTDASGVRLRRWLGLTPEEFYDRTRIAILPMGFCYPGRLPAGGDLPPRPQCAPLWRARLLALMPEVRLTLLVGSYAMAHALGPGRVGERVSDYPIFLPHYFPLPHPSWRTQRWEDANPWFGDTAVPALRHVVRLAIG